MVSARSFRVGMVVLLGSVALTGCAVFAGLFGKSTPTTRLKSLQVSADPQANADSATAIDVLFVYDTAVLPLLPADAGAWFRQRDGLRNTLGHAVDVVSLEVPPPYLAAQLRLPARSGRALRVLAYANYLPREGLAPIDVTTYKHVTLKLLADRIDLSGG